MGEMRIGDFRVQRVKIEAGDVRHVVIDFYGQAVCSYPTSAEAFAEASRRNAIEMRNRSRPRRPSGE